MCRSTRSACVPITGAAPGSFRIARARPRSATTIMALYARLDHRVGAMSRTPFMWERLFDTLVSGGKAECVVVHTSPDGVDDGYVHYSAKWTENRFPDNAGHVQGRRPLRRHRRRSSWRCGPTSATCRSSASITCDGRPEDDALRLAIADVRGLRRARAVGTSSGSDCSMSRRASPRRSYGSDDTVTIAVADPWFADNTDTFRVSGNGVERVHAANPTSSPRSAS